MFVQLTHSSLRASHSWWWKTSISSLDRLWKTLVYPLICCSFLLIFTKGRTCQRWDHQNNLLTNTSFFFLLLSLFQVVYCLHELARVAFANKWVTFQIVDKTGQYEFGQEELRQAAIDRNTTSTFKKKKKNTLPHPLCFSFVSCGDWASFKGFASDATDCTAASRPRQTRKRSAGSRKQKTYDKKIKRKEISEPRNRKKSNLERCQKQISSFFPFADNAEQIANNRQTFVLNQEEPPRTLIIEGWSKAEGVSGQRDQVNWREARRRRKQKPWRSRRIRSGKLEEEVRRRRTEKSK